jgi:hypothetical protein
METLVAVGISSIVLLSTSMLTLYSAKSFAALVNYTDLDMYSRNALDLMSREIRQANYLVYGSSDRLVFNVPSAPGSSSSVTLAYIYYPSTQELIRIHGTHREQLLKGCSFLRFDIFQRNPIAGTYDQYPTAAPVTCKLVQLNWVCERTIMGLALNTESVQSAKIVIRKQ